MTPNRDPGREKVERADEALREAQDAPIEDATVVVKAAALGVLTVLELARLARDRAGDPGLREFAVRMARSHDSIGRELAAIAGRKALDVPTSLVHGDEQMLEGAPEDPAAFDAWFLRQGLAEYAKAIAVFESGTRLTDLDLAAFARRCVPALRADREALFLLEP